MGDGEVAGGGPRRGRDYGPRRRGYGGRHVRRRGGGRHAGRRGRHGGPSYQGVRVIGGVFSGSSSLGLRQVCQLCRWPFFRGGHHGLDLLYRWLRDQGRPSLPGTQ